MPGRKRDDVLAAAMATGGSVAEAAKLSGMSRRTAERRMATAEFRALLAELRRDRLARAMAKAEGLLLKAADRLGELIGSTNESVAVGAVKAVPGLLAAAAGVAELDALKARMAAIESAAKGTS